MFILCSLFLCVVGAVPVYADEYTLTEESYSHDPARSSASAVDLNSWLATVPDDMDFDTYQEIMAMMHPEFLRIMKRMSCWMRTVRM